MVLELHYSISAGKTQRPYLFSPPILIRLLIFVNGKVENRQEDYVDYLSGFIHFHLSKKRFKLSKTSRMTTFFPSF